MVRIGHRVTLFEPASMSNGPIGARLHYRTGYRLVQPAILKEIERRAGEIAAHDLVWIDSGEAFGRRAVARLSGLAPTVLFCLDDPTGGRDGRRFDSLVAGLPEYDLCVTVREPTLADFRRLGARRAIRVWRAYDEIAHRPPSAEEMASWTQGGGVVFLGTWMAGEDREAVQLALMRRGLPVSIWGSHWSKSPRWRDLAPAWRGPALYGRDYCRAIVGAEACLGFVSTRNRDLHTTRSLETPYAGGLFVARRTDEHAQLFEEGLEAIFWDDAEDCADQCAAVMADPERGRAIRAAGMARVRRGDFGNETMVAAVLAELGAPVAERRVA